MSKTQKDDNKTLGLNNGKPLYKKRVGIKCIENLYKLLCHCDMRLNAEDKLG